jgi:hypothetical protein
MRWLYASKTARQSRDHNSSRMTSKSEEDPGQQSASGRFAGVDIDKALVATELSTSIDWPETGFGEINHDLSQADLNEAALRQTLSRARCQLCG